METANQKATKSSSIVSKFAKAWKLKSISFSSSCSGNTSPSHRNTRHRASNAEKDSSFSGDGLEPLPAEDDNNVPVESQCDAQKVRPLQCHTDVKCQEANSVPHFDIDKVFETVSALKLAYIQLQNAHIPHNPAKIRAADECIVRELESLCKIKREFKEKLYRNMKSQSQGLVSQIHSNRKTFEKLQSEIKDKEFVMIRLRSQLQELEVKNDKLVQKLRCIDRVEDGRKNANRVVSAKLFEEVAKGVPEAIHDFAKALISLMKAAGWDLDSAARVVQSSAVYCKRSHKKFAFEAYIARRMFHGFSVQSHENNACLDNILRFENPMDALDEDPTSSFADFCRSKYLMLVHPTMEASFFGNLDHRDLLSKGKHPRTTFYRLFLKMAKSVWVLQEMAGAIRPNAQMFGVQRGTEFSDAYMEPVLDTEFSGEEKCVRKVEFMVNPGFHIGETTVKSRVYISCSKPNGS